ncbi:MAG: hypothetical protein M3270_08075 [Thermoproteota archaeon]|nr:hypothetical protein [Thermoproteota archaeon]
MIIETLRRWNNIYLVLKSSQNETATIVKLLTASETNQTGNSWTKNSNSIHNSSAREEQRYHYCYYSDNI